MSPQHATSCLQETLHALRLVDSLRARVRTCQNDLAQRFSCWLRRHRANLVSFLIGFRKTRLSVLRWRSSVRSRSLNVSGSPAKRPRHSCGTVPSRLCARFLAKFQEAKLTTGRPWLAAFLKVRWRACHPQRFSHRAFKAPARKNSFGSVGLPHVPRLLGY